MCRIMEDLTAKATALTKRQNALKLLRKTRHTLEEISDYSDLSIEEVRKLAEETRKSAEHD